MKHGISVIKSYRKSQKPKLPNKIKKPISRTLEGRNLGKFQVFLANQDEFLGFRACSIIYFRKKSEIRHV